MAKGRPTSKGAWPRIVALWLVILGSMAIFEYFRTKDADVIWGGIILMVVGGFLYVIFSANKKGTTDTERGFSNEGYDYRDESFLEDDIAQNTIDVSDGEFGGGGASGGWDDSGSEDSSFDDSSSDDINDD